MARSGVEIESQGLAQQTQGAPDHRGSNADCGKRIEPQPAGGSDQQGADEDCHRDGGIGEQVQHRSPLVEVVVVVVAKQAGREQIDDDAGGRRPGHRAGDQRHGIEQALDRLHHHHRPGREDQQAIDQRRHLGAAAKAVGEAPPGRPAAELISPPAQHQAHHIAEVVEGIANQGQGAKGEAHHQLQGGEDAIEGDAPAKGTSRPAVGLLVLPVIVVVAHGSGILLGAAMGPETLGGHRRSVLD